MEPTPLLDEAVRRHLEVNGEHPMTEADDAYVREHFVPAGEESLRLMLAGQAALPSYVLSDGTPMVPREHLKMAALAGGPDRVRDWFLSVWPDDRATAEREWELHLTGRRVDLATDDAVGIRRAGLAIDQARAALEVLLRDPLDVDGRASLWEAVNGGFGVRGLGSLLLPMTAYDRLRFDAAPPREQWVDSINARWFSPTPAPLPVRTERLVLRDPRPSDAADLAPAYADPAFVRWLLTEPHTRPETDQMIWWRSQPDAGPHRARALVIEHDGRAIGDMVIMLQGIGLLNAELGWTLAPWASGQGFATEAAAKAMEIAFTHYGVRRVTAGLDADNGPSAALAERLGMVREVHKVADFWSKGAWSSTYEYGISREEWLHRREV